MQELRVRRFVAVVQIIKSILFSPEPRHLVSLLKTRRFFTIT